MQALASNTVLTPVERVSSFRKIAIGTWGAPRDPQIYGTLTVRMERALAFIEGHRARTGERLTVTHLVGKAVALALAEVPEANTLLRRWRPHRRSSVSVFFSVATEDPETGAIDLSGAKLDRVDERSLSEIVGALEAEIGRVRGGRDEELKRSRDAFRKIPFPAVGRVLDAISFGLYGLNLDLSSLGIPKDPFGSVIVTNIGSLGLSEAYAPLMAYSRTPLLLAVGEVREAPVVEGGEVTAGQVMRIHATLDHRLLDGAHAARISKVVKAALERPEELLS